MWRVNLINGIDDDSIVNKEEVRFFNKTNDMLKKQKNSEVDDMEIFIEKQYSIATIQPA